MQPGDRFILLRTMENFLMIRREQKTPGGTKYVVSKNGEKKETSLHHGCHVEKIDEQPTDS
jgi:hypothetical protein